MEYRRFVVGDLETNCYLLWSGIEAGIIDPGGTMNIVIEVLQQKGLKLQWIVNTHGHADHIIGNQILHEKFGAPILIHSADRFMLTSTDANLSAFIGEPFVSPDADRVLNDGDILQLGTEILTVLTTPGHTLGGISLVVNNLVFAGDTLFCESIGRTDLPGGDFQQELQSIQQRLFALPPETLVLPGHGEPTTISHEIKYNPYISS